jgi:guanine deaminase
MHIEDKKFLQQAIDLAVENVKSNKGGPFGALIVQNGKVIATGTNTVTLSNDPTAHAEISAIRDACSKLNSFQLKDCVIYSSCEPCPMCLGAIYWTRFKRLVFAADKKQAANADFDDDFIYKEIILPLDKRALTTENLIVEDAEKPFLAWKNNDNRTDY